MRRSIEGVLLIPDHDRVEVHARAHRGRLRVDVSFHRDAFDVVHTLGVAVSVEDARRLHHEIARALTSLETMEQPAGTGTPRSAPV